LVVTCNDDALRREHGRGAVTEGKATFPYARVTRARLLRPAHAPVLDARAGFDLGEGGSERLVLLLGRQRGEAGGSI
jgi:hypothetical protein